MRNARFTITNVSVKLLKWFCEQILQQNQLTASSLTSSYTPNKLIGRDIMQAIITKELVRPLQPKENVKYDANLTSNLLKLKKRENFKFPKMLKTDLLLRALKCILSVLL